jgi:hypothetical protein
MDDFRDRVREELVKNNVPVIKYSATERIAELEAEVKIWQQQSNMHYMQVCELDKRVADLEECLRGSLNGRMGMREVAEELLGDDK